MDENKIDSQPKTKNWWQINIIFETENNFCVIEEQNNCDFLTIKKGDKRKEKKEQIISFKKPKKKESNENKAKCKK